MESTEPMLDEVHGVGIVHSRFYLLLSELAQREADHKGYYRLVEHLIRSGLRRSNGNFVREHLVTK